MTLSEDDQIVAAIRQIIRAVDMHSRQLFEVHGLTGPLFEVHGLTGPQLAVLKQTMRLGPASPKSLARAVHLSQATVTGILRRLENRSLISRQPSAKDRRSVTIEITAQGELLLSESPSQLQDRFRDALSSIPSWERMQILATMQRVASLMDADTIDAAPHLTPGEIPQVVDEAAMEHDEPIA